MQTRFYFDPTLVKWIPIIFEIGLLLMAGASLLGEMSLRPVVFLIVANLLLGVFWICFARGTYIEIVDKSLQVSRMFLRGKVTLLADAVSIHQRPIYGGLFAEVYMKVRRPDGTVREQGLINKPGLTEADLKRLVDLIRSANPSVAVDEDLLRK
jgi:hypothetical protein